MEKEPWEIIREARQWLDIKQEEVANWIKTDKTNYGRKERGETTLTANEFFIIYNEFIRRAPIIAKRWPVPEGIKISKPKKIKPAKEFISTKEDVTD